MTAANPRTLALHLASAWLEKNSHDSASPGDNGVRVKRGKPHAPVEPDQLTHSRHVVLDMPDLRTMKRSASQGASA